MRSTSRCRRVPETRVGVRHARPLCGQCRIEYGLEEAQELAKRELVLWLGQWWCKIHHLADKEVPNRRERRRQARASLKVS